MVVSKDNYITEPLYDKLKNGTEVTILPYNSIEETPEWIINLIFKLFNDIIEEGNTYPQEEKVNKLQFLEYYFPHFVAVLVKGHVDINNRLKINNENEHEFLGCFYIKPNYIGRSNHVCNGGFLVSLKHRGEGIGTVMGRNYLKLAPLLGFKSSVFNLVYETNVASCRIWDNLGFKRIGRVPKVGRLKDKDYLVDAIMYGYDFTEDL
jgi:RimJ/RimL family protein N-acetyltransferase